MAIDTSKVKWDPEGPDPSDVQWDSPPVAAAPPKKSGVVRRTLGDTSVDLAKGVVGAGEALVGVGDLATAGLVGRGLEAIGYDPAGTRKTLDELYSPERQQANQEVQQARGFLDTAGAMVRNPSTIVGAVAESLPSTLGGAGIARRLGETGIKALASPVARAAIGEGAISAGQAAEQSRQQSDDRLLSARQGLAAVGSGLGTGLIAAGSGGVARRLGIADVDVALAGGATAAAGAARPGLVRRTLQGAFTEGALEELPQSAQEQAFSNIANDRPIGEGVAEAGAAGLLTGAAMGGPVAAIARPAPAEAREHQVAATAPTPLPDPSAGPLSRVAHDAVRSGATSAALADMAAAVAPPATQEAESATSTAAAPTHRLPPPPWIDTTSGEITREPTLQEGKAYIHEQLNRMEAAGEAPLNRAAWKRELGISNNALANTLIGEVKQERARGLRAPAERRVDVMDRLRSLAAPASETDRAALGAKETVGPRDAVRLFSELLGTEQGAVSDLVAEIPAENGRRDTVAVLQAAQQEMRRRQGGQNAAPGAAVSPAAEQASSSGLSEAARAAPVPASGTKLAQAPSDEGGPRREPSPAGTPELASPSDPQVVSVASAQATPAAEPVQGELAPRPAATSEAPAAPTASAEPVNPPAGGSNVARMRGQLNVRMGGQEFPVGSVEEASTKFLELRDRVGDIGGMRVVELTDQSGNAVGYIGHNGEVFEGSFRAGKPSDKPIYDPKTLRRYADDDIEGEATRIAGDVAAAASEAATSPANDLPEPSDAQKEAGNFRVGRMKINGLDISIEHPAGVKRKAEHTKRLKHAYGYIRRTEGADGEKVDVFLGDRAADTSLPVYVVDQNKADGTFDEHKALMGFASEQEARDAYLANYPKRWKGLGGIREMSQDEFKAWVREPANTKAPASQEAPVAQGNEPQPPSDTNAPQPRDDAPDVDVEAVKKKPAFRKAMKAIDAAFAGGAKLPATDGQALVSAATGWADAKAGRPPRASERTDLAKLSRGMNPVDFYISAYAAAKGESPTAVRARSAGELYDRFGQPSKKPATTTPTRASAEEQAIDDFGEVLHGARKHLYAENYRDNLAAAMERDPTTSTLAEAWPAPDYAKLLEDGADPWTVAFVHAARDEVPTKPTKPWRVTGWATQVTALREFANNLLSGKIAPEKLRQELLDPRFNSVHKLVGGRADLYVAVGHDVSLKGVTLQHHNYTLYNGQRDVSLWVVERARKATAFSNWPTELATGKTREEAIAAFKARAATLRAEQDAAKGKKPQARDVRFNLYANRLTKKISIGVKIGKGVVTLQDGFDTSREAREYLAANREALVEKLAKLRDIPEVRRGSNSPRVGVDHRDGADVSPEQFAEAFGFRGVQFGNYVEGPRRQRDLNEAYDALMDLAGVLDISPRALSLNGELGLAFGARGKGGKRPAAAHYEPGTIVINLTKSAGAGSLAHEWWHALDNYFSRVRQGGRSLDFATDAATNARSAADPKGMRVEMMQAFARVMKAIGATDVPRRSQDMDALRTGKAYWSTGIEMSARSFETYVIAKLADQNGANDYLANVVSEQTFEALGRDDYPYPKADELPAIRAGFDDFFATIEQRDEGGRVALFSKAPPASFRQQVAERLKTVDDRGPMLDLGRSPAVLRLLKLPDLPLRMPANVLFKVAGGKGGTRAALTEQQIARLPELIDDPVAIFRDPRRPENVIVQTSLVDAEGLPVQVAIRADGRDGNDAANVVLSAFGRVNASEWVQRAQLLFRGEKVNPRLPVSNLNQRQAEGEAGGSRQKVLGPEDLRNFRAAARGSRFSKGQEAGGAMGVSPARARALLGELTRNWGDNAPAIRLVTSAEQLPPSVRSDPDAHRIEGLYEGSPVVWLNLGRIQTEQRFAEVLAHEAIGHFGVERVVGQKQWADIVDAIERVDRSGGGSAVLRQIFAEVRRKQPAAAADRVTFAKEVIAFLAERGVRNSWVNRVVAAVRRFLRRLMPSLRWNEADVRGLLGQADSFLRRSSTLAERRALVRQYSFSQQGTPFYSALVNAVDLAKGAPKKGDAAAWKGWLDGAQRRGEFRQAEREWLDIDGFLERNGTTTREQLLEYVRANELQVQDVVLGDPQDAGLGADPEVLFMAVSNLVQEKHGQVDPDVSAAIDEWVAGDITAADLARLAGVDVADIDRIQEQNRPRAANYKQYTLPGGENYRELLLTLPERTDSADAAIKASARKDARRMEALQAAWAAADDAGDSVAAQRYLDEARALSERLGGATVGELQAKASRGAKAFHSTHFDQPNILAHVRFNERVDADGQRVLFIEEIQSDWHQQGRAQGYTDGAKPFVVFNARTGKEVSEHDTETAARDQVKALGGEFDFAQRHLPGAVPNAPFKNTDEWAMLAFKRMVRWAADNGFDRIAWTTGEQQADRYDLAKTVSEVSYSDDKRLIVRGKNGSVIHNETVPESRVPEIIGKEAAERLLAQPWRDWSTQAGSIGARARVISGDGLTMGGVGMRAFYDKILPAAVNKWGKRFGAKVGRTSFDTQVSTRPAEVHSLDLTPPMREAAAAGLPLFSKAPAEVLDDITAIMDANQPGNIVERARGALRDLVPSKAKDQLRSTWLGALTTRHLTELGSDYFTNIKHYSDFLAEMGADRNELQQEGEKVAESARRWASKHRAEARQLFDLMHDATIDGVDPAEAYQPLQFRYGGQLHEATQKKIKEALAAIREQMRGRAGDNKKDMLAEAKTLRGMPAREKRRRANYPGLVQRWNQLSPQAQEIYRQFRDMYKSRSEAIEQALVDRIQDTDVPANHKQKIISVIRQQFETQRLQGVYFPLQRHGRFFVAAEKQDQPVFLMFDRLSELEGAVRDLKRRGFKVTAQGLKSAGKAQDAPSGTFVAEVIESLRNAGVSDQTQDEIYQLYLQTLPELSMRKHAIHRQAVPGFDPDAVRAFAFNMHHGAHQLARLRFAHKLQAVLDLLKKQQDAARQEEGADTRKIAAGDAILGELGKRHEWIMNPQDSQVTSLVSSFGFIYYLGLTPAAALVNLTQTALVSYPYLASRHGPVKAMNMLLAGARDSIRTLGNIQKTLTDPDELRAHAFLQKSGALDKSLAHNLAGIAEGGLSGYNPAWARAMEIIGWGFHKAEVVNREATGMAAFRLAKADGASFNEAVRAAVDAINDTHFDYTNQNRARFMQGGTAKVLLMFRQYSLNMTWHLGRMVWQATKGEAPEVRKLARRNLAGVLGMSALFSGTLGLPLMSVTMGVLNAIAASAGDDDEPWDAETEFRAFLADMLGPDVASLVLNGPVNAATGADIASRVSLSQLWFRDADRELDGRGQYFALLEQAAGPMGGVLKNALVGKQLMDEGHLWRGVETTLPKSLKDMMRAARYAQEGVNTLRGDPLIEDATLRDTLLQLIGFTPAKVADRYDRNRALKNYEQILLERRGRLMDAFAMATRLGDGEARRETLQQIRAFNRKNPEIAITAASIRRSLGQRARYSARAEHGITIDRRLARRVREAVGD